MRAELSAETPSPSAWFAPPLGLTTFCWLLGELTAVNALTQFALVVGLILTIMALLGLRISRRIAFPLAFLLFSVPIGDFMLPTLMDWTARFTVSALRATGIPVYQEGNQFIIPSGNWSVVEACSGIRYIIASITVGSLFAYLSYTSLRRRMIFIGVSIIVPVIANWLRAYMIVMLGHLSGNKLAVGVDHLIYGWVFFGIVILLMFMIGARWAEDSPRSSPQTASSIRPMPAGKGWVATVLIALIAAAGPMAFATIDKFDQASAPKLGAFPTLPEWQEAPPFASWIPDYDTPPATLQATFSKDANQVSLYVAYYRNQDYRRKLITSTNTLVATTNRFWSMTSRSITSVAIEGVPSSVRETRLLGKDTTPPQSLIVWQWYWINGRLVTSDAEGKLQTAFSRLRGAGDDSAVIMLYAPAESSHHALTDFAAVAAPMINNWLMATRNFR